MNTKILTLLTIFGLLVVTVPVMAEGFIINYDVQTTGFAVEVTAAGQTQMNFTSLANGNTIYPVGSTDGVWGKINNIGDVVLNFQVAVDNVPSTAELKIGSEYGDAMVIAAAGLPVKPSGWASIPGGTSANIYAEAKFNIGTTDTSNIAATVDTY